MSDVVPPVIDTYTAPDANKLAESPIPSATARKLLLLL